MKVPKVLGNSVIYTAVTVLQRCISFFLLPLYTTYLTPADYGITGVVSSVSSLLAIFCTLGLSAAGSRFYYKYNGDPEYSRKLYGTIACSILINSALFGGIFLIAHKLIVDPMVGGIDFYPCVLVGLLNVLVTPLYTLYQSYLQTIQDGVKFGINAMLNFLLILGLTILFVVPFRMGALGVLLANLIASVVFFIYVFFDFFIHQKIGIDKQVFRETYKYSLPLLPHTLANWSNGTIDKLLVNGIRSETDAGLYNLGNQYSSVADTIAVSINNAYVPWFYDKANDVHNNMPSIRRMSEMITYAVCLLSIILAFFSKEVLDIMISNPAYDGVWKVIPFLICGVIFNSIYFFYVNILFLKNTGVIFTITVSTIFINVGLNLLLIPLFGFIGAGIANMLTYISKSLFSVFVSMRVNKDIRFRTLYLFLIGVVSSVICLMSLFFEDFDTLLSVGVKVTIIILLSLFIYHMYKKEIIDICHNLVNKTKERN